MHIVNKLLFIYIFSIFILSCTVQVQKLSVKDGKIISLEEIDQDGDGYCISGYENNDLCPNQGIADCDDDDSSVYELRNFYLDSDNDGYGSNMINARCSNDVPPGYSDNNQDCNDQNSAVNLPGGTRIIWNQHPNPDGDLMGFRIHLDEGASTRLLTDIPDVFATEVEIDSLDLNPCIPNDIYVTSYDWSYNESTPSLMVCWGIGCI